MIEITSRGESIGIVMKNTKRFVLGLVSSLLLAVGFVRAADSLDPVLNDASTASNQLGVADSCTAQCWAIDDGS
jgi:hypothetical protein